LSQSGMVRHWMRDRRPGWRHRAIINGTGAVATGIVTVVIGATKFTHGAWIVVLVIPTLVATFMAMRRHYDDVAEQLSLEGRAARAAPHGADHRRRPAPRRRARGAVRQDARGADRCRARRLRRDRPRQDGEAGGEVDALCARRTAGDPELALPLAAAPARRVSRRAAGAGRRPHGHRGHPGVPAVEVVAARDAQPDGAPDQGHAAVPQE